MRKKTNEKRFYKKISDRRSPDRMTSLFWRGSSPRSTGAMRMFSPRMTCTRSPVSASWTSMKEGSAAIIYGPNNAEQL